MFASDGVTDGRWAPHGTTAVSPALRSARGSGPPPGPPVGVDDYGPPATEVRRSTALTSPPAHRERRRAPTRTACDTTPARGLAAGPILCGYTTLGRPPVPLSLISCSLSLCAMAVPRPESSRSAAPVLRDREGRRDSEADRPVRLLYAARRESATPPQLTQAAVPSQSVQERPQILSNAVSIKHTSKGRPALALGAVKSSLPLEQCVSPNQS